MTLGQNREAIVESASVFLINCGKVGSIEVIAESAVIGCQSSVYRHRTFTLVMVSILMTIILVEIK